MRKSILVNGITLDGIDLGGGNLVPLLLKIKTWQSLGCHASILCNTHLKKRIDSLNIIDAYEFIEFKHSKLVDSRVSFVCESLKRNLLVFTLFKKIKGKYDAVYSISSVLDLVLFPWFLRFFDKKIRFFAVFDNRVSLEGTGALMIRLLAWIFFQTSLFLIKKADKVFTVSKELESFLIERGFEKSKIKITGNGLQSDLIVRSRKNEKYSVDALFVGRIHPAKGIYDALKVLLIVRETYPGFQLAIMGRGDVNEEKKLSNTIKELNLFDNVQVLGYLEGLEKFNILKSSKCFLFLSESESFGQSLLEAISCGIPAIAYDLQAYKEIYRNNEVFIVKKNDVKAAAEKILEIFREKKFENTAGKLLANKFGWEKFARKEFEAMIEVD